MDKKKLYEFSKKYINSSNIKMVILFIPLLILFLKESMNGRYCLSTFLDTSILVSFFLLFVCEVVAGRLSSWIMAKCEDAAKLTEDYENLNQKYCREKLIQYKGIVFPEICIAFRKMDESPFVFNFQFDTKKPIYQLPNQIAEHSMELMEAHAHSTVYNNMNVRLNHLIQDETMIEIVYSRTTYFDSLITNRSMDYPLCGKSIREIYEPGPFLSTLSESKLSNHLGFNGFVELANEKIIFIHRNTRVSIGKNMLATSIGASYKTVYGLDEHRCMTKETLDHAIRMEIKDELKIDVPESYRLDQSIFAFYRDIVEGGKPQFLFYIKLSNLTVDDFEKNFYNSTNDKKQRKKEQGKVITDGEKIEYFTIDDLLLCTYEMDGITTQDGRYYRMMPSSIVSIVLLLNALGKVKNTHNEKDVNLLDK